MNTLPAPAALPDHLVAHGEVRPGLWVGEVTRQRLSEFPGRGRERRWWYSAAATPDGSVALGVAAVSLGLAGTVFAWLWMDGRLTEVSHRVIGPGVRVGTTADEGGSGQRRGLAVTFDGHGGFDLAAAALGDAGVRVTATAPNPRPVVCATPTLGGGANITQKAAGHGITLTVVTDGQERRLDAMGWYDWTRGRQDRRTSWRWAAGAGHASDGRSVGINLSTGMNEAVGENVVWIDGQPIVVGVDELRPSMDGDFEGTWRIAGPGWGLDFRPVGVRAADENLVVVRSRYVQPVGMFEGTLPAPGGGTVDVQFPGVTEDHEAVW